MTEQSAVQITTEQIKYALEHDAEFFIQFFLGDELTYPVPEFHSEIFWLMVSLEATQFACAVPRDHAKTTLAKLACVYFFLFSDYSFILYLSNTVTIAIPSVNDVIGFLECDNFKSVFGELKFTTRQDGKGIYAFYIGDKRCILRAHGAGQQVRGINIFNQRPELGICDDIEDVQNNATEDLYRKLKRWFYGPFKKAFDKFDHKIIHIGNLTENRSLIADHCQSEFWHSRVYGCLLSNGQPLWPDAWPIEKLKKDFSEYVEAGMADVWFAEMMNMPTASGLGIIKAEEITYAPHRLNTDIEFSFITIDLAISEQTSAHKTVVCVHGFVEDAGTNGQWQIVEYQGFHGIDPISLFWKVIALMTKWNVNVCGIEAVAYQASLKYVFEHECLRNGMQVNTDALPMTDGIAFVQLQAVGRKPQRIIPWAAMVKAGEYALNEGDFVMTQELLLYRPDRKDNRDDHIDAAAYAPQMMQRYMYLITQKYKQISSSTAVGSYSLCSF